MNTSRSLQILDPYFHKRVTTSENEPFRSHALKILSMDADQLTQLFDANSSPGMLFIPDPELFYACVLRSAELQNYELFCKFLPSAQQTRTRQLSVLIRSFKEDLRFSFEDIFQSLLPEAQREVLKNVASDPQLDFHIYIEMMTEQHQEKFLSELCKPSLERILAESPMTIEGVDLSSHLDLQSISFDELIIALDADAYFSPFVLRNHCMMLLDKLEFDKIQTLADHPNAIFFETLKSNELFNGVRLKHTRYEFSPKQRLFIDSLFAEKILEQQLPASFTELSSALNLVSSFRIRLDQPFLKSHCASIQLHLRNDENAHLQSLSIEFADTQDELTEEDYFQHTSTTSTQFRDLAEKTSTKTLQRLEDLFYMMKQISNDNNIKTSKISDPEYSKLFNICRMIQHHSPEEDALTNFCQLIKEKYTSTQVTDILSCVKIGIVHSIEGIDPIIKRSQNLSSSNRL